MKHLWALNLIPLTLQLIACGDPCDDPRFCMRLAPVAPPVPVDRDGWDDLAGSGVLFYARSLRIVASPIPSLDDHENGDLTDSIQKGLIVLFELAGLDHLSEGEAVTLKVYSDGRLLPDRLADPKLVIGTTATQAVARFHARLEAGRLRATVPGKLSFEATVGVPPYPQIELAGVDFDLRLDASGTRLSGTMSAAIPVRSLAATDNPYCKTTADPLCPMSIPESNFADLMTHFAQPDVDLDGDGLEQLELDPALGRIKLCRDGDGTVIPPVIDGEAWSCALSTRVADGYRLAVDVAAEPVPSRP